MTNTKPVARWNAVSGARYTGVARVGVCAHHIHGIDRVVLAAGGEQFTVTEPSVNPRTGAVEYWADINPAASVSVSAEVYANDGSSRMLSGPLTLESTADGSHGLDIVVGDEPGDVFVSLTGSDSNTGTREQPFATIERAIRFVPDGGNIVLLDVGRYEPPNINVGHLYRDNAKWITIKADHKIVPWLCRIAGADGTRPMFRANMHRLRLEALTLDFERMSMIYELRGMVWVDNCLWTDREGYFAGRGNNIPFRCVWFATECVAEECPSAFAGAAMVSECSARRISGDVFQNTRFGVGCIVDGVDGRVNGHHTDLFQFWGARENTLFQTIRAKNLIACQSLFIEPTLENYSAVAVMRDTAFVDVTAINDRVFAWNANEQRIDDRGTPPLSQMYGHVSHMLFDRVKLPHQQLGFRTNNGNIQAYTGDGVVFRDCMLHQSMFGLSSAGDPEAITVPDGVEFDRCKPWIPGDTDHDGDVDFADLNRAMNSGDFRDINEALANYGRNA